MSLSKPSPSVLLAAALVPSGVSPQDRPSLVELDHLYVVVSDYRDAARQLIEAGVALDTASISRHEGGGTASVSAIFENAYLEIIWVEPTVSVAEANRDGVEEFKRAADWAESSPSPFGVGLRRTLGAPDSDLDVLAFRFPGAGAPVCQQGAGQ